MVEAFGKPGGPRAYHLARACTLAPDAVTDPSLPGRLAAKELQASAKQFWSLTEQGALAYRAGRFEEAVSLFEQSLKADLASGPRRGQLGVVGVGPATPRENRGGRGAGWARRRIGSISIVTGYRPTPRRNLVLHIHNWLEANVLRREAETVLASTQ